MRTLTVQRWVVLICAAGALAGCGFSPPLSSADRETLAECRSDADRVYNARNRAQLSQRDDQDAPFSGASQAGLPSTGLSDRYGHEQMVDNCIRHGALDTTDAPH